MPGFQRECEPQGEPRKNRAGQSCEKCFPEPALPLVHQATWRASDDRFRVLSQPDSSSLQVTGTCVMARCGTPPEDQGECDRKTNRRSNNEPQQWRKAMKERRFDGGGKNPQLS